MFHIYILLKLQKSNFLVAESVQNSHVGTTLNLFKFNFSKKTVKHGIGDRFKEGMKVKISQNDKTY